MIPKTLSIVDVETTGMSAERGRIIEIGIIRIENNKIVEEFSTLINPYTHIDPFILSMTGILPEDLQNAPSFYSVSKHIKKLLSDSVFVAHNVMFDYSFIKKEFERLEESFISKYCCSVKLSRHLYPHFRHHNLDAIIKRFKLNCQNRHRALDDARVIWDFYRLSLKNLGEEKLTAAFNKAFKRPSLPVDISEEVLSSLPEGSGVYIFYNKDNFPLYIGKSKNIKNRVLSHFYNSKKDSLDRKIAQDINRIECTETAGELGALLLESSLIKKLIPLYNRKLRHASKLLALKKIITPEKYYSVSVVSLQEIPIEGLNEIMGIFKSGRELKSFLLSIAKEYFLCLKLLGFQKSAKNCFNYHLNLCKGSCGGKEAPLQYNLRFSEAFLKTKIKDWPFKGPIGLKEKSKKEEVFVIDKWCVLGKLKSGSASLDDISREYVFDTDAYKILNQYLKTNKDFEIFSLN